MTVAPHCHFKVDVTGTILDTPIANVAYFDTFDTYGEAVHTLVTALRDGLCESPGPVDRVNITHGHDHDRWVSAIHEVVIVPQWHHLTGDTMPMRVEYHAYCCSNPDCLVR